MKKIVHILNTNSYSGAENVVVTLISNLKKDINYECFYVSLDGPIAEILKQRNIAFYPIKKMNFSEIKRVIKLIEPDIIHCHDFTASIITSSCIKNIPIISHLHNNPIWIKTSNCKSLAYKFTLKKYSKILLVSDAILNEYKYSKKMKNVEIISNPIDVKSITNYTIKDPHIKNYDIIFLGRLDEQKDPLRFIELINKLKVKHRGVSAAMVGNGSLRKNCAEKIEKLNLMGNIDLLGFKENRFDYILNSKIMCITSKWEGFGLMAVEALSFGIPIVSTKVGGLTKIINEDCGKFCKTDQEFISELDKLMTDTNYYIEKKKEAVRQANRLDNISTYINKVKCIYEEI